MEIIYPDNFIKFFNDDDIDDIGEYEIFFDDDDDFEIFDNDNDDDDFDLDDIPFIYYNPKRNCNNYINSYNPYLNREHLPINYQMSNLQYSDNQMSTWQNPYPSNQAWRSQRILNNNFNIPGSKAPLGFPPLYIPSKNDKGVQALNVETSGSSPNLKNVSSNSIRFCLFKFTYIWQRNSRNYWAYLIHVDRRSVAGFRWVGWRWVYFGVDLRKIDSFICY